MNELTDLIVETLEQAVAKLNACLDAVTDGSWGNDEDDRSWSLHGQSWPGGPELQILKAAKEHPRLQPYWPKAADAEWITMMDPVLGRALGAWLAKAADDARATHFRLYAESQRLQSPDKLGRYVQLAGPAMAMAYHHPLQVARAILGEPVDQAL